MMSAQFIDASEDALAVSRSERRRCPRYSCHGSAEAMVLFPEFLFRGEILDISLKGCFLKTKSHAPMDRYSRVDLRFSVNGNQYRTLARVMGVRSGNGVGVEFYFDSQRAEAAFRDLVRSLSLSGEAN
jgi:hypothetical protein